MITLTPAHENTDGALESQGLSVSESKADGPYTIDLSAYGVKDGDVVSWELDPLRVWVNGVETQPIKPCHVQGGAVRETQEDKRFRDARIVATFSRLMGIVERHRESVLSDPIPHLERASAEISKLREAIKEARYALSGMSTMLDPYDSICLRSMESIQHERIRKAMDALDGIDSPPLPSGS